jgi:lysozyme
MIEDLLADLKRDEGFRSKPYLDTVGKVTIGYGRNLDDVGLSEREGRFLLGNDLDVALGELDRNVPWWRAMPDPAQRGLANMCFNLGFPRLNGFRNMLAALEDGRYQDAAVAALDSRWARQVGDRAKRIASLYRQCE